MKTRFRARLKSMKMLESSMKKSGMMVVMMPNLRTKGRKQNLKTETRTTQKVKKMKMKTTWINSRTLKPLLMHCQQPSASPQKPKSEFFVCICAYIPLTHCRVAYARYLQPFYNIAHITPRAINPFLAIGSTLETAMRLDPYQPYVQQSAEAEIEEL